MKNDTDDHDDQADDEFLTFDVPDEVLEVAASFGGSGPTISINILPPNCC